MCRLFVVPTLACLLFLPVSAAFAAPDAPPPAAAAAASPATPATAATQVAPAENEGVIGTLLEVQGTVTLALPGQAAAPAAVETPIHLNDVVETGPEFRAFIQFIDNTQITLAESTKLKVDDYVFDADNTRDNKASYNILRGAFSYVSGLVAKKENPDVHIEIPFGSIGIRGTELWGGVVDGEYGVQVDEGQVNVKNDAGETLVSKGEGTSLRSRDAAPPAARVWPADKLKFAHSSVALKNHAQVMKRAEAFKERQQALRGDYRNYLKQHPQAHPGSWRNRYQQDKRQRERGAARAENRGLQNHEAAHQETRRGMRQAARHEGAAGMRRAAGHEGGRRAAASTRHAAGHEAARARPAAAGRRRGR